MNPDERKRYNDLARENKLRFMRESHERDCKKLRRQDEIRREREQLVLDGGKGGRSTRSAVKKANDDSDGDDSSGDQDSKSEDEIDDDSSASFSSS